MSRLSDLLHERQLTSQHKQIKPLELSASPALNPEEQVDTDSQPAELADTALNLLKASTVNLSKATDNSLNTALQQELRDITVLSPVNLVRQAKDNTAPSLSLDHRTAPPLAHLLDPDSHLRELTDNSPRVSTDNNLDKDRPSTDSSLVKGSMVNRLDRGNMDNSLDRDSMVSSQDKDRDSTVNNLPRVNMVNNQDKVNMANNQLKANTANSPLLPVEEVSMLGTSRLFYSNVFKM